jgi:ADP-heptose:LPS heptosyltransferase
MPRFQLAHPYKMSEVESNMRIARYAGYGTGRPNVSDWCRKLKREARYDIGIIPGSKAGIWIRKRYPGMAVVARTLAEEGARIAVIGRPDDGVDSIPGEKLDTSDIARLPDALASCRILIGTDSGAAHVGSSLGIPLLMLVTSTCPVKATPIGPHKIMRLNLPCSPCQSTTAWQACTNWKCQKMDPENVAAEARAMIMEAK